MAAHKLWHNLALILLNMGKVFLTFMYGNESSKLGRWIFAPLQLKMSSFMGKLPWKHTSLGIYPSVSPSTDVFSFVPSLLPLLCPFLPNSPLYFPLRLSRFFPLCPYPSIMCLLPLSSVSFPVSLVLCISPVSPLVFLLFFSLVSFPMCLSSTSPLSLSIRLSPLCIPFVSPPVSPSVALPL